MKTACIFLLFEFFCIAANASSQWTAVTKTYQSVGYANLASIQKLGDITSMNILIDYQQPPFDGNNLSYRSLTFKSEYNCLTKQFRTLKLTSHTGNMATGRQAYHSDEASEWQAVSATSIQNEFWKTACQK